MSMEVDPPQYKLRCQLIGHEEDVRGLCVCGDIGIASGSRDKSVRLWILDSDKRGYVLSKTLVGHNSFVGPVAWIPPNENLPGGGLVSGGMDAKVLVWDLQNAAVARELRGHELQVSSVALDSQENIVSASVDGTVRRWKKGNQVEVLRGHKGPVQAVVALPSGEIVSGSSDMTIKVWQGSSCTQTTTGHSDTVRGLAFLPDVGLLSASHDCTLRLWSISGEVLQEMVGHTAIVYSVAVNASGEVASGSEDGTAKIWRACSDAVIRLWTLDSNRCAPPMEIDAYEAQLTSRKTELKTVGGVKVADLPGIEALEQPGTKDGQTRIVREGNNGVAYSWNAKEYKWDKIGDVVDGPSDTVGKRTINGVTYDFVFDVDIGDGVPPRKLSYNRGQNPHDVAEKWLLDENLPAAYRSQIVDFIIQNTGEVSPRFDTSYVDPYTGGNAYVPSSHQTWMSHNATAPKISETNPGHSFKHIPKKGMLYFDTAQFDGLLKKLGEFNDCLGKDEETKKHAVDEMELARVQFVCKTLKETTRYHVSMFADRDFELLSKILLFWPISNLFPALDLLRMILLHPHAANHFAKNWENGKDVIMDSVRRAITSPVLSANLLTSARLAVNSFRHTCLRSWVVGHRSEILDLLSGCCTATSRNVRLAFATLVLNYAVLLISTKDEAGQTQVLSAALEMAGPQEDDVEVKFRALVAVGSLMHSELVKNIAIDLDVKSIIDAAVKSPMSKISEVGMDMKFLLGN